MTEKQTKRPRRTYTDEFKMQLVHLYQNGKRKCDIIKEYDIAPALLDKWIKRAEATGEFSEKANRSIQEQELLDACKELKYLRMENDILKQAALILGRK